MRRRPLPLLAAALLLAACQGQPPAAPAMAPLDGAVALQPRGTARVALTPRYVAGAVRRLQAVVTPYTLGSINHMIVKVYSVVGATETFEGQVDIAAADLGNTITFGNLAHNTTYRFRAHAYGSAGTGQPISVDGSSSVDVAVGTDDAPALGNLVVQLADVTFSGEAVSGGLAVIDGTYTNPDPIGIDVDLRNGVDTVAGGTSGMVNGTGGVARFSGPRGIAAGPDGNFYVADTFNHAIRKVTPGGVVTTVAGGGTSGGADGNGASAQFSSPEGIAVMADGTIWVADSGNHKIRRIATNGDVTTIAGNGTPGSTNNTGSLARFNNPKGITVGGDGDLYVSDTNNHMIRKVTTGGVVTTFAGATTSGTSDGTGTAVRFNQPIGIATDGSNFYVCDYMNHTIRLLTSGAVSSTLAGTAGAAGSVDDVGADARFDNPRGIAWDATETQLYVTDYSGHVLRRVTPGGNVTTRAGLAYTTGAVDATNFGDVRFNGISGVTVDADGRVYLTDELNERIRRYQAFAL